MQRSRLRPRDQCLVLSGLLGDKRLARKAVIREAHYTPLGGSLGRKLFILGFYGPWFGRGGPIALGEA